MVCAVDSRGMIRTDENLAEVFAFFLGVNRGSTGSEGAKNGRRERVLDNIMDQGAAVANKGDTRDDDEKRDPSTRYD